MAAEGGSQVLVAPRDATARVGVIVRDSAAETAIGRAPKEIPATPQLFFPMRRSQNLLRQ